MNSIIQDFLNVKRNNVFGICALSVVLPPFSALSGSMVGEGAKGCRPHLRTGSPSLRNFFSDYLNPEKICQSVKNVGRAKRALASRPGCGQRFVVHAPVVGIDVLILKHRTGINHGINSVFYLGCGL